jgi:serine/threonine protein phosphatase PrpC
MTPPRRPFHAARATATGARVNNEDRSFFFTTGDISFCGVADGLGGHPRGEVAAQLIVDVCEARFRQCPQPLDNPEAFMLDCIRQAHRAIRRYGARQHLSVAPRTTAVLALVKDGTAHWLHVGDSRLYLARERSLWAHTEDHVHDHYVQAPHGATPRLRTSLTRCLGGVERAPLSTCCGPCPLVPGDTLLLCSDGLWGQADEARLLELAQAPPETLADTLQAGVDEIAGLPGSDNVTAVVFQWQGHAGAPQLTPEALQATVHERFPDDIPDIH